MAKMPRRNAIQAGIGDFPPELPAVGETKAVWAAYGKKVRAGWVNAYALLGSQRVLLDSKDETASTMASQLDDLRNQLDSLKLKRKSEMAVARRERGSRDKRIATLEEQLREASSTRIAGQVDTLKATVTELEASLANQTQESERRLKAERQQSKKDLALAKKEATTAQNALLAQRTKLERELAVLRAQSGSTRNRLRVGPGANAEYNSHSNFRADLYNELKSFMENRFDGGCDGDVAATALHVLLLRNAGLREMVLERLGVREDMQHQFITILKQHWSVETCTAMFLHGGLTHAGYQAVSNIASGTWNAVNEQFDRLLCPDGSTPLPRWASLHKITAYIKDCCDELGLTSLGGGQAAALSISSVLKARLEELLELATEEDDIPDLVTVQLAADSAGWHKKPEDSIMKSFTSFVVKPILEKLHARGVVGESVNSANNNRLAMLYAGKDCHHLLEQFLNDEQTSDGSQVPSIIEQLSMIAQDGVETNLGQIDILWKLGGDLKFLVECFGVIGNAANHPCHQCTCRKDQLWKCEDEFRVEDRPTTRTLDFIYRLLHAWGEEYGLTEPYLCPGCHAEITAENRHPPETEAEIRGYPALHFSHRHGVFPLFSSLVQPEDAVPDSLHGFLRSIINMFFVGVSMDLTSQQEATTLSEWMEAEIKVSTEPSWNQASRDTTKKIAQKWNGKECWDVLTNMNRILEYVYPADRRAANPATHQRYVDVSLLFNNFVELMAAWMLEVPDEDLWPDVADMIQLKAKKWRNQFVRVAGSTVDCTPTMHSIVYHYSQQYRRHGPLVLFCMQGLEAKHRPVKAAKKNHANKKSFLTVGRAPRRDPDSDKRYVHATSTDIMQVTRRVTARDAINSSFPAGKATRKRTRENNFQHDALSAIIAEWQQQMLDTLASLGEEEQ